MLEWLKRKLEKIHERLKALNADADKQRWKGWINQKLGNAGERLAALKTDSDQHSWMDDFRSKFSAPKVDLAARSPLESNRYALLALIGGLLVGYVAYIEIIESYYKNFDDAVASQAGGIQLLSDMEEFDLDSTSAQWTVSGDPQKNAELAIIAARAMEALGVDRPRTYSEYYIYPSFRSDQSELLGYDLVANRLLIAWNGLAEDSGALTPEGTLPKPPMVSEISPLDQFLYLMFDDFRTATDSHCRLANVLVLKRLLATAIANPPLKLDGPVSVRRWLVDRLNEPEETQRNCLPAALKDAVNAFYDIDLPDFSERSIDEQAVNELHRDLFPKNGSIIESENLNIEVFGVVENLFNDEDIDQPVVELGQVFTALLAYYGMTGSVTVTPAELNVETDKSIRASLAGARPPGDVANHVAALQRISGREPSGTEDIRLVAGVETGAWDEAGRAHMVLTRNSFLIAPTQGAAAAAKDALNRFKGWEQACIIMSFFAGLGILLQRTIGLLGEAILLAEGINSNTNDSLHEIRARMGMAEREEQVERDLNNYFDDDKRDDKWGFSVDLVVRMLHLSRNDTQRERRKDEFLELLEAQEYGLERSHAWLNLMIMLVPTFAFIGTVDGIMTAFPQAKSVISASGKIEQVAEITNVTGALGLAFATTFVGLILAMILRIGREIVASAERRLVANCRKRFIRLYQKAEQADNGAQYVAA